MNFIENELMGKRLRRVRSDLGMTQMDMAEVLEVSEGHYKKLGRGVYGLDVKMLILLYSKLQVDPLFIMTGELGRELSYIPSQKNNRDSLVCELLDYCKVEIRGRVTQMGHMVEKASAIVHRIPIQEVIYLECWNRALFIHTIHEVVEIPYLTMAHCMSKYEQHFVRCHRSYAINPDYISKVNFMERRVDLGGNTIDIGRSYVKGIRQILRAMM